MKAEGIYCASNGGEFTQFRLVQIDWLPRCRLVIAIILEHISRVVLAMEIAAAFKAMYCANALAQLRTLKIQLYLP